MVDLREEVARVIERAILGPGGEVWQEGETEPWQWSPESIAQALAAAGLIQPLPASFTVEKLHKVERIIVAADWGGPSEYAVRRALLADVRSWADALDAPRVPVEPKEPQR